ncbi:MAG: FixH family protein [Thermogemmatispora sp.]|uniref:FixH family protein n=1 Tax=Thermogemmatispora sp. TaxID=1968838 RepID=UPI00262F170D|nr:FixH family protein [Thermogemmatispora sp.]MBX5458029.1 FixH family protein [Thermogemmatispora sp.]
MRVRPIFWLLLAFSCAVALTLSALWPVQVPAVLQVHVAEQAPLRVGTARLQLQLTDPQGTPIEQAQVSSSAWMPDMVMGPTPIHIQQEGHGSYSVLVFFSMPGAWAIKIEARARGFTPQQQILHLEIA